jgi:hypothetical protein
MYAEGRKRNESKFYYCVEVSMNISMEITVYVFMHPISPEYTHTHAHAHARTRTRTHARAHARTRAHTHTRTHTRKQTAQDNSECQNAKNTCWRSVYCMGSTFVFSLSLSNMLLIGQHKTQWHIVAASNMFRLTAHWHFPYVSHHITSINLSRTIRCCFITKTHSWHTVTSRHQQSSPSCDNSIRVFARVFQCGML